MLCGSADHAGRIFDQEYIFQEEDFMFKLSGKIIGALTGVCAAVLFFAAVPAGQVKAAGVVGEQEPNDSIYTANSITANTEYSGTISKGDDYDYYKFTVPASGHLKFSVTASPVSYDNSYDVKFTFLDSEEEPIISKAVSKGKTFSIGLLKGTYYLKMSQYFYNGDYSFHYTFTKSEESFADTGKDNTMSGANDISIGNTYKGMVAANDTLDYYKFTLKDPGTLSLIFNSGETIHNRILDTKGGVVYDPYNHSGESRQSTYLSKGTYYLEVERRWDYYCDYSFSTSFAKISLPKTATVVCGDSVTLAVENRGSKDVEWKTSNSDIATVSTDYSKKGTVKSLKAGPATIYAKVDGVTLKCSVQVLYKDVTNSKDFWYAPTNYLTNKDIVKGYDKQTLFKPNNKCTRAQMVTFLWRLKGSPKPKATTTTFKDIKTNAYYYKAVVWAVEKGITTGVSKKKFNPSGVCTRAQTVTFLWRMAGKPKPASSKNKFTDINSSDYFYKAVLWASGKKIVEGYKNNTFRPQNKCTRRQMVTFLYKYDKYVNGKG